MTFDDDLQQYVVEHNGILFGILIKINWIFCRSCRWILH